MHGIKRGSENDEKLIEKMRQYRKILTIATEKREQKSYTPEGLGVTGSLLKVNPESYSTWNYRRDALLHLFASANQTDNAANTVESLEKIRKLLFAELDLVKECVVRNPKSYWVWNQRVWTVEQLLAHGGYDLKIELDLCSQLLSRDSRNFHCWCYRRYIAKLARSQSDGEVGSDLAELEFSKKKIEENFSNYSAWHQRSILLAKIHGNNTTEMRNSIEQELDFVQNAFYTEPRDQSAWIYHRWLLSSHTSVGEDRIALLQRELKRAEELQSIGDTPSERKWPALCIVRLLQELSELLPNSKSEYESKILELLEELAKNDNDHSNYYHDMRQKRL